ncbi:MAG: hypothetical protein IJD92_04390 [Bacilli bacterium]|nr:hypothetical protein [Bacilli bacterium]
MNNIFINEAISSGISNYLLIKNGKDYDKAHIFEVYIIRCLCKIYGDINILNPYRINNENSFKSNLIMYGLNLETMKEFISLMDEYSKWLNSKKEVGKTDITSRIEIILINMIIERNKTIKVTDEEIEFFDKYFDPSNNNFATLHKLITKDVNIVPMYWNRRKVLLNSDIKLKKVRNDLLSSSTYDKYGIDKNELSKMSEEKVKNINNRIIENEKRENKRSSKFIPKNIIITSGNGFVDTIMLLSIMTTEIMIGIMIALYFMRS